MNDFLLTKEDAEQSMQKHLPKVVRGIKEAGRSIILNAEKMVGGYRYQIDGVDICIHVDLNGNPDIGVEQRFVPEGIIENKMNTNENKSGE